MSKDFNFKKKSFTITRKPLLPFNNVYPITKDFLSYQDVKKLFEDPLINKAIYIASENLHYSLENDLGKKEKLVDSFFKYYVRMCTRTTPFGLFASTEVKEEFDFNISNNSSKRSRTCAIRLDRGWLSKITEKLIEDNDFFMHIKIKSTSSNLSKEAFLINYNSSQENDTHFKKRWLKKNPLNKFILETTKNKFVSTKEIFNILTENIPILEFNTFSESIRNLIKNGFLITNIHSWFSSNTDVLYPLTKILDELDIVSSENEFFKELKEVLNIAKLINNQQLDFPLDLIKNLKRKMKKLSESENYLDCILIEKGNKSYSKSDNSFDLGKDFLEFVGLVSNNLENPAYLVDFYNRFLEKYSQGAEVNVLEVIDDNDGIGFPNFDLEGERSEISKKVKQNTLNAVNQGDSPIDIQNIYDSFNYSAEKKSKYNTLNDSVELFIMDIKTNNFNSKDIYLAPSMASLGIGDSIGRFFNAFGAEDQKIITNIINDQIDISEKNEIIMVSLVSSFPNNQLLDLVPQEIHTKYVCPININCEVSSENIIDLNDVVMSIKSDGSFYFKSIKLKKEIKFVNFSNLNIDHGSLLYKFLLKLSENKSPLYCLKDLFYMIKQLKYQPEVRYKNLVITQKSMVVEKKELETDDLLDTIRKYFGSNYVYIKEGDNRLLINLENTYQWEIFCNQLNRKDSLELSSVEEEIIFGIEHNIPEISIDEKIVSFENKSTLPKPYLQDSRNYSIINKSDRIFPPFSDWVYLKLYMSKEQQKYFLPTFLSPFIDNLIKENIIDTVFFIRYIDPKEHLRIRFLPKNELFMAFFEKLNEFNQKLFVSGITSDISFATYEREIERYGGVKSIESAEKYFMGNSLTCMTLLKNINSINVLEYSVIIIQNMLTGFNLSIENQRSMFSSFHDKKYSRFYREHKHSLINLYKQSNEESLISELITQENYYLYDFKNNICSSSELSQKEKETLIFSCIHMFCNRLFGPDRNTENKVMGFTEQFLRSVQYIS